MTTQLRCANCGKYGYDVSTRIVENTNPALVTTVPTPNGAYQVPARFISQLRCMDAEACRDRAELSLDLDSEEKGEGAPQ